MLPVLTLETINHYTTTSIYQRFLMDWDVFPVSFALPGYLHYFDVIMIIFQRKLLINVCLPWQVNVLLVFCIFPVVLFKVCTVTEL